MREESRTREEDPLSQARRAGRDQGLARSLRIDQTTCSMHVGGHTMTVFPLLELPDGVLANVLQRCPPGSIAGFPLPVALAQVRVTGSVDPHWARPLLHAASKCPAVLDHLSRHLRSVDLSLAKSIRELEAVAGRLARLESLTIFTSISESLLAILPMSLTSLSFFALDPAPPEALLTLTGLEELNLGFSPRGVLSVPLPRLLRLSSYSSPADDIGLMAPNLEALAAPIEPGQLGTLPLSLTRLNFSEWDNLGQSLLPLTRLTALADLTFPRALGFVGQLPELVAALVNLTRLEVRGRVTGSNLPELLEALKRGPDSLGLCILGLEVGTAEAGSPALKRLFEQLLEVQVIEVHEPVAFPWASLTRLTRLMVDADGTKDASWIQSLSQLPGLRELEVMLLDMVPEGFGSLTQCTSLMLRNVRLINNLSCLQQLTRLRECSLSSSAAECLAALPDCLTRLYVKDIHGAPCLPFDRAIRHLTALERLGLEQHSDMRLWDLSLLRALTSISFSDARCPEVQFRALPCLRALILQRCSSLHDDFLRQMGCLPSLRELVLHSSVNSLERLADAILTHLTSLSLLEELELPRYLGRVTSGGIRRLRDHAPLLETLIAGGSDCAIHEDLDSPGSSSSG